MTAEPAADDGAEAGAEPAADGGAGAQPLRVSMLELFFDLVFVFTITQLTGGLSRDLSPAAALPGGALRVLLIFGVLWWMYGGYAWLTNARTPGRLPERLLVLLGMAGFLVIGLAGAGLLPAVGRRARPAGPVAAAHPSARPVLDPAGALHRTARRADYRGVR